jgi:hypothetical protein
VLVKVEPSVILKKLLVMSKVPLVSVMNGPARERFPPAPMVIKSSGASTVLGSIAMKPFSVLLLRVPFASRMRDPVMVLLVTCRSGPARLASVPGSTWMRLPVLARSTVESVIFTTGDDPVRLLLPLNVLRVSSPFSVFELLDISTSGLSAAAVEVSAVTGAVVTVSVDGAVGVTASLVVVVAAVSVVAVAVS